MTSRRQAYVPGDHLVVCDRTGFRVLASEARKEWTGAIVRGRSWEPRHPQDFVRAKADQQAVTNARPMAADRFLTTSAKIETAAVAGATTLTVDSTSGITSGNTAQIGLDSGDTYLTTVIVSSSTALALGTPLPGPAAAGMRVRDLGVASVPEADRVFGWMAEEPSTARKALGRTMVAALIAGGVWTRLDGLWLLAAHSQADSLVNWIAPGRFTVTVRGTPTFTVDRGWTGNGTNGYLTAAGFKGGTGTQFVQDDASLGVWDEFAATSAAAVITVQASPFSWVAPNQAGGFGHRSNAGSSGSADVIANAAALYGISRSAAASYTTYQNGVALASKSVASTGVSAGAILMLTNLSVYLTTRISAAYVGASLTDAQNLALYNALNTFLTAIGAH